jgi:hypothetical protein
MDWHDEDEASEPDSRRSTVEVIEVGAADDERTRERSTPGPAADMAAPIGVVSVEEFTVTDEHLVGFDPNSTPLGDRSQAVVIGPPAEFHHHGVLPREQMPLRVPADDAICTGELLGAHAVGRNRRQTGNEDGARIAAAEVTAGFVDEPVFDRYAILDAGRGLPDELLSAATRGRPSASDDPFLNLGGDADMRPQQAVSAGASPDGMVFDDCDAVRTSARALDFALSEPVMRMLGDDSLWEAEPDELIDRLLPLLDELIDTSGGTGRETVAHAGQYDVVQPETNRIATSNDAALQQRPYSQLFSQLRRRHPSSS